MLDRQLHEMCLPTSQWYSSSQAHVRLFHAIQCIHTSMIKLDNTSRGVFISIHERDFLCKLTFSIMEDQYPHTFSPHQSALLDNYKLIQSHFQPLHDFIIVQDCAITGAGPKANCISQHVRVQHSKHRNKCAPLHPSSQAMR